MDLPGQLGESGWRSQQVYTYLPCGAGVAVESMEKRENKSLNAEHSPALFCHEFET